MLRDIASASVFIGAAVYFGGYIWSAVMSWRHAMYGWLAALILIGPITYPVFALMHYKTFKVPFHLFWVGLVVLALCFAILAATKPEGGHLGATPLPNQSLQPTQLPLRG